MLLHCVRNKSGLLLSCHEKPRLRKNRRRRFGNVAKALATCGGFPSIRVSGDNGSTGSNPTGAAYGPS